MGVLDTPPQRLKVDNRGNVVAAPGIIGSGDAILCDDIFDNGTCGWTELYVFAPADWNVQHYLPLTLSPRGNIGRYALRLQTNNTPANSYGGGAFALKRLAHKLPTTDTFASPGVVRMEFWFTFGSDNSGTTNGYNAGAPRALEFNLDSSYPTSTTTSANDNSQSIAGKRAFFTAFWQQSTQSGGNLTYTGQWFLSQGSGIAYGQGGYVIPTSVATFATGYRTNFFFNQNKHSMQYVSITYDTFNGNFISLQANNLIYDLTRIPSNGNAPLNTMLAPNDPNYNVTEFAGGLNPIVRVDNVLSSGNQTASWLELHRAKVSYV